MGSLGFAYSFVGERISFARDDKKNKVPGSSKRPKLGHHRMKRGVAKSASHMQAGPYAGTAGYCAYISALESRIVGQPLNRVRLASAFLLRTVAAPARQMSRACAVRELRRIGKRIAIGVEDDLWLVLHLMIAGRLHWRPPDAKLAAATIWQPSIFPTVLSSSLRPAPNAAHRCTSSAARRVCIPSTLEESTSSPAISTRSAPFSPPKTTHSSGR